MGDMIHLHTHSNMSAFDGLGRIERFVERAAEMGHSAISFTEHGSLRGLYNAHHCCQDRGVKLIPGVELYFVDDAKQKGLSPDEKKDLKKQYKDSDAYRAALAEIEAQRRSRSHITAWALNAEGLRNLYQLTTWSWIHGFYFYPRVDINILRQYSRGIAVSTGCPGGVVPLLIREGRLEEARAKVAALAEAFPGRFYVELMPHVPTDCLELPDHLVRLAQAFSLPLLATQDAHYPDKGDCIVHDQFLCIQTRSNMSDPDRFRFDGYEYWLASRDEMVRAYEAKTNIPQSVVRTALDNTLALGEAVDVPVACAAPGTYLPAPPLPAGVRDYDQWLLRLCAQGVRNRMGMPVERLPDVYRHRLRHELCTIRNLGFAPYFIVVWDMRMWAERNGIAAGPRGSAAGSLVSYLIGISDLDPVQHGLLFERFLNPSRKSLPDIDMDFESGRVEEVIDYLADKYGSDKVARISTFVTLGGKQAIRDVCRINGIPESEAASVAAMVTQAQEEEAQDGQSLRAVLRDTEAGRAFAERYGSLAEVAAQLEGELRGVGLHAAGVVISRVPLADIVPIESRAHDGRRVPAVAYDMHGVEGSGLVKLDVLGLRTLSVVADAYRLAGKSRQDVDLADQATLDGFSQLRFAGVFQYDSPSSRRLCRGFRFRSITDVAVMTALNRPGPIRAGMAGEYVRRAADPSKVPKVHKIYDDVTGDTYGVLIFQEQIMELARRLCGYSPEDADVLRSKIAKKKGVSDERDRFVEGATRNGMERHAASELFDQIVGFGAYGFNRAHAFSYAYLAFQCMWLKVHYPAAYYTAAISAERDDTVRIRLAAEARQAGIRIEPPDVTLASNSMKVHNTNGQACIIGGLEEIKHVGIKAASAIIESQPFTNLLEFRHKLAGQRAVTSRTVRELAGAHAFRRIFPHTKFLHTYASEIWDGLAHGWVPEVDVSAYPDYSDAELMAQVSARWPLYVDMRGCGILEEWENRLRRVAETRTPVLVDDPVLDDPGLHVVLGRVSGVRVFGKDSGDKEVRITLTSGTGGEIQIRLDADHLRCAPWVPQCDGSMVLVALSRSVRGWLSCEGIWELQGLDTRSAVCDPAIRWLLRPPVTKPRNLTQAIINTPVERSIRVTAYVLRVRRHVDRNGNRMRTVTLLGYRGWAKCFVFSSRMSSDVKLLQPGAVATVKLTRLEGDEPICYLARNPVRVSG